MMFVLLGKVSTKIYVKLYSNTRQLKFSCFMAIVTAFTRIDGKQTIKLSVRKITGFLKMN